jgi:hypothetical protein
MLVTVLSVQELPSRNTSDLTSFDPFFEPPARDPPRDLPPIIKAGTVVPPMPSAPLREYIPRAGSAQSSRGVSDSVDGGLSKTTAGIIIGAVALGVLLCALCAVLFALRLRKESGKACTSGVHSRAEAAAQVGSLKKLKPWEAKPLVPTTEFSSVCPSAYDAFAT